MTQLLTNASIKNDIKKTGKIRHNPTTNQGQHKNDIKKTGKIRHDPTTNQGQHKKRYKKPAKIRHDPTTNQGQHKKKSDTNRQYPHKTQNKRPQCAPLSVHCLAMKFIQLVTYTVDRTESTHLCRHTQLTHQNCTEAIKAKQTQHNRTTEKQTRKCHTKPKTSSLAKV